MLEAPLSARTWGACRALVAACAVALLASGSLAAPAGVRGSDLGDQIADGRSSQAYYQSAMRKQDRVVSHLKHQQHETRRALKQAKRTVKHDKRALRGAIADVQALGDRVAELEALYVGLPPEEIPDGYADRLSEARKDLARAKNRRVNVGQRFRLAVRVRHARQEHLASLGRSLRVAVSRRESAEDALGAYIVRMTDLAAQRAELQSDASLSTVAGFTWPSVGRISQTYGCTGVSVEPRRGSCRHFHDGLDIVSGYGSRVSTVADGVVAFAGWNPWDEHGRAWIMVVSHPDGFVTRYGHLLPGAIARVGRFVRQGEAIGRMGNTGRSTGTHLHLEVLRDGVTVNPLTYLPRGMATVKEPRHQQHGDHKGKHPGHRKQAGRHGRRDRKPEVLPLSDAVEAGPAFEPQAFGLDDEAAVTACQAPLDGAVDAEALARNGSEQDVTGTSDAAADCPNLDAPRSSAPAAGSRWLADASAARHAVIDDASGGDAGPSFGGGVPMTFRGTSPDPV